MIRFILAGCLIFSGSAILAAGLDPQPPETGEGLKIDEIRAEIETIVERYSAELKAAKGQPDYQAAAAKYLKDLYPCLDRVFEWVDAHPGDKDIAPALRMVVKRSAAGPSNHSERALKRLVRDYPDDPQAIEIIPRVANYVHWPISETYLKTVLERNSRVENQAASCFWLGEYHAYKARHVRKLKSDASYRKVMEESRGVESVRNLIASTDPEKSEAEAIRDFEITAERFGDSKYDGELTYAEEARGRIYAIRNLIVGKIAPDIQGKDFEGKPFSLYEHRGKLVLLTFSGNWCGPCVAMYPHEREIVKRYEGEPFVALSVNTDDDVATLRKSIDKGDITWRCWFDGGTHGPITAAWGVHAFPDIYVIDGKGVIRFRNVRDKDLDEALEKLMAETSSP